MQTKQELTNQINAIVSEYLGFETQEAGLHRFNKAQLAKRLAHYQEMIELDRHYRAIQQQYTSDEWVWLAFEEPSNPVFHEAVGLGTKIRQMWDNPPIR